MPKININGVSRELTAEELAEREAATEETPAITPEQRLDEIEAAMMELANMIGGE